MKQISLHHFQHIIELRPVGFEPTPKYWNCPAAVMTLPALHPEHSAQQNFMQYCAMLKLWLPNRTPKIVQPLKELQISSERDWNATTKQDP